MADLATYAGQQPNWTREGPIYPVQIDKVQSGHEIRTVWGTAPRYRYDAEIILQGLTSEVAAVVALIDGVHESGHTFTLVDPVTGSDATVRLDGPLSITPYQGLKGSGGTTGWFMAKFTALSVIPPPVVPG